MTLSILVFRIAIAGLILTGITYFVFDRKENPLHSYVQNFLGAWYVFSGWIKATDPLGLGYKMVDYFAEFQSTFEGTWMSFIAPLFPFLSSYSDGFSVFMICLEIALGLALIVGAFPKATTKIFLLLLLFFTFLTGFTHLTGYVPRDANFFEFAAWGEFDKTNMRVTDCGCFGDFLKLEPKISFYKDLWLLIPALFILFGATKAHQLFNGGIRAGVVALGTIGIFFYCLSNFSWDLPGMDFRPFKKGVNINTVRAAEVKAQEEVKITHYKLKNKKTNEILSLEYANYLKQYKNYPKTEWEVLEQVKTEPTIEATKISEFEVQTLDGNDATEDVLNDPNFSIWIVSYKLKDDGTTSEKMTRKDSIFTADTLIVNNQPVIQNRTFDRIETTAFTKEKYLWNSDYTAPWKEKVSKIGNEAQKAGLKIYSMTGLSDPDRVNDFISEVGAEFPFLMADDILLKTILRSNPGILLVKNGQIIDKWHHNKVPTFTEMKARYIK